MQTITRNHKLKALLFIIFSFVMAIPLFFLPQRTILAQLYPGPGEHICTYYDFRCGLAPCAPNETQAVDVICTGDCATSTGCNFLNTYIYCAETITCGYPQTCPLFQGCGNSCSTQGFVRYELYYCTAHAACPGDVWNTAKCKDSGTLEWLADSANCPVYTKHCTWNDGCDRCTPTYGTGYAHATSYLCPNGADCTNSNPASQGCTPDVCSPAGGCYLNSECNGCKPQECVWSGCDSTTAGCPNGCGSRDNCFNLDPSGGKKLHGASCTYPCPGGGGGGGATPTPTPTPGSGTAQVRAHIVDSTVSTCDDVTASTNYLGETVNITPDGTPAGSQTAQGGSYASWTVTPTDYTILDTPPAGYVMKLACWNSGVWPASSGQGITAHIDGGQTITWELGYSLGTPWAQTQGGDVYAQTSMRSYIPSAAAPRYFSLDGAGGSPGIVQYGTTYDFDSGTGLGEQYISSAGYLANDTNLQTDYYAVMYKRFGSPTTVDYPSGTTLAAQPVSRAAPYYVPGDLTVDGSVWSVGTGQSVVVLVNGNLTLKNNINITGSGFVAFIVNGDITVAPTVGVPWNAAAGTSALDGIYITSPGGVFATGDSSALGFRRFVGKGTFIAGGFAMQRNLDIVSHNVDTSAELFIYNPQLLLTMPDAMRDVPITWQEVAP